MSQNYGIDSNKCTLHNDARPNDNLLKWAKQLVDFNNVPCE